MDFHNVSDDVLLAYVKDDKRIFNRLMLDDAGRLFVNDMMSTCSVNSKLRERAVAKLLGLRHNLDVNGWDAKDVKGRPWEIKTEQRANEPINGTFKWHFTSEINLDRYVNQPLVYGAFTPQGRCIFICGFLVKNLKIIDLVKNRKTCVTFSIPQVFNNSIVYFYNPRYLKGEYVAPSFLEQILDYVEDFEDEFYAI